MTNPIVVINASVTQAPQPNNLQQRGAFLSQGGTTLAVGSYAFLSQSNILATLLSAALPLASLTCSGTTVTGTLQSTSALAGTYNSSTGLVTLTLAENIGFLSGASVTVSGTSGTGSYASVNGTWTAAAGTTGTTLTFFIQTGLTMTISGATGVQANLGRNNGDTFYTTIAGATAATTGYNGSYLATVTSASTFTYPVASTLPTPATGAALTYTPPNVGEVIAMNTTYWAQGSGQGVYVLELGPGEPSAGVTALTNFINNSPQFFYAYLIPRNWDGVASFVTFANTFTAPTKMTYFYVTTVAANQATYNGIKSVFKLIEAAGVVGSAEFDCAAAFYDLLTLAPNSVNKAVPFEYQFEYGVTPWALFQNAAAIATMQQNFTNYIGPGSEGGLSNSILFGGVYADGNPVNFWYALDWVQINVNLNISNAVINGSNNKQAPLYYNQTGINALQTVAGQTMSTGITFGLVLNPLLLTNLDPNTFAANVENEVYANVTAVNAIPFADYIQENPNDYAARRYAGYAIAFTPLEGFDQIIFNVDATTFA